jgi:hypothetical protein
MTGDAERCCARRRPSRIYSIIGPDQTRRRSDAVGGSSAVRNVRMSWRAVGADRSGAVG